jgi:DNA-binding beta-propeller fold protein YncE
MRFAKEVNVGEVILGGNGTGPGKNQLSFPRGLSFDRDGNLYVGDQRNHRVQRFSIKQNSDPG